MQATGSRAEEPTATGGVPPPLWSPRLLVLFSSSVSHIHWGCLGRRWEKMKFKGTNNKVSCNTFLLSSCHWEEAAILILIILPRINQSLYIRTSSWSVLSDNETCNKASSAVFSRQ